MNLTVEATYEKGMLKPIKPLPLKEHQRVRITVDSTTNWVQETYGICGWIGGADEADRFATDPDLDFPHSSEAS